MSIVNPLHTPSTDVRLRTSIKIYAMVQPEALQDVTNTGLGAVASLSGGGTSPITKGLGAAVAGGVYAETISNILNGGQQYELGSCTNFSRTQTREIYKRFSLGANSHQPFQVVPLAINTKVMIERVVLYKNDDLKKFFGFWGESLANQLFPMMLIEYKFPQTSGDLNTQSLIIYSNCWFSSNPIDYDIHSDDLLVIRDCEIEVGAVQVYDLTASGIIQALETASNAINVAKNIFM